MTVRIAIPQPSSDADYNERSLPPYFAALKAAGAEPVLVPLDEAPAAVAHLLASTNAVLLPGSRFDIDPERFGQSRIPECGPADPARTAVDELLLQDAFNLHKPILGICHGAQGLNVWCNGSLFQDLPSQTQTPVNHTPGRTVSDAHPVQIAPGSKLAAILPPGEPAQPPVNSSHHQAIHTVGDNLRVSAVSPADGVVEAIELDSADHFVLAVQWHPERTYDVSAFSRAIFATLVDAAANWRPRPVQESVAKL
jgi:putative glutamine amidotransferase